MIVIQVLQLIIGRQNGNLRAWLPEAAILSNMVSVAHNQEHWHICLYGLIHPGSYRHVKDKVWVLLSVHGPEHMQLMLKAHRLAARMVLPRFTLLPSPQVCIQLSHASAQLLHGWGPQHHTLGNAFSIPWHCSPRAAGAKAGMKGPIVYHAYKGSVLRFLWGQGNAERQLPTQEDRVKLCSFESPRMGIHLFRTAEAASKPRGVRIPEESSVPRASGAAALEGDTGQTKFCHRPGTSCCERKPFSAGLAEFGVKSLCF